MKRVTSIILILLMCFCLGACEKNGDEATVSGKDTAENAESVPGGEKPVQGDDFVSENTGWFPKEATMTYPDGSTKTIITSELSQSGLSYRYNMYDGDKESYIMFDYAFQSGDLQKITQTRLYNSEGEPSVREGIFAYDSQNMCTTFTETDKTTGETINVDKVQYTFDDSDRVSKKTVTSISYDNGEPEDTYVDEFFYTYGEESFDVYTEWKNGFSSGDKSDYTYMTRATNTVYYDSSKGYKQVLTDYDREGNPLYQELDVPDGNGGYTKKNRQRDEYIMNSEGFAVSKLAYYTDGSTGLPYFEDCEEKCEFDDKDHILKYENFYDGELNDKGEYTYDENGNISRIAITNNDGEFTINISWMNIPQHIDDALTIYSGTKYYAIGELIEDVIPMPARIDCNHFIYKKADLFSQAQ